MIAVFSWFCDLAWVLWSDSLLSQALGLIGNIVTRTHRVWLSYSGRQGSSVFLNRIDYS